MSKPTVQSEVAGFVGLTHTPSQRKRLVTQLSLGDAGGSAESPLKVWNGTAWVTIPASG